MVIENTGNSIISLDWANSLPPDGWEIGFAAPPTVLGPRETSDLIVGVKAPVNELTSTTFDVGIYATINNGFDTLQVSESYPVEVLSRAFCSIDYDEDSRPLLGIDRDGNSIQTITIRNTGNLPLDSNLTATTDAKNWDVSLTTNTISNLAPGDTVSLDVEVGTNDDTKAGIEELILSCDSTTVTLEISVKNTQSQGGLFGIVSPTVAYSVIGALVLGIAIVARRIKKSALKTRLEKSW